MYTNFLILNGKACKRVSSICTIPKLMLTKLNFYKFNTKSKLNFRKIYRFSYSKLGIEIILSLKPMEELTGGQPSPNFIIFRVYEKKMLLFTLLISVFAKVNVLMMIFFEKERVCFFKSYTEI